MLERVVNCLCHPKMIAKYFKDKASIVFLTILVFFGIFVVGLGFSTFTTEYFSPNTANIIISDIIKTDSFNISYDSKNKKIVGNSASYNGNGYIIQFLPNGDEPFNYLDIADIVIVFNANEALVKYVGSTISVVNYSDVLVEDFSLSGIKENNVSDIYNFKQILTHILDSSGMFFLVQGFISEIVIYVFSYLFVVLIIFFTTKLVNPTIDSPVRRKLCFYDGLIFFIVEVLALLTKIEFISYLSLLFPIVYSGITFRHIIKVPVKK